MEKIYSLLPPKGGKSNHFLKSGFCLICSNIWGGGSNVRYLDSQLQMKTLLSKIQFCKIKNATRVDNQSYLSNVALDFASTMNSSN